MSIAEGVQAQVAYKAYGSGAITSNAEAVSSSDLGATGAQVLRRVSSSLKLAKATYQSNEIRSDRQIADFRHGGRNVTGSINGEFSTKTYFDFIEAACRGTRADVVTADQSDLTSAVFSASTSAVSFGGGSPPTLGFRVGMIIQFSGLTVNTANNGKNFLITAISGATNRTLTLYPAPATATSDTTFDITTVGKSIIVPTSGHVSRKFGIEHYFGDVDFAHLFTECRVGGFTVDLPATGMSTIEIPFMGRDMEVYSSGSAPFFTSPTAAGTDGIMAAVNGLLVVGGSTVGVVTGLQIKMDLSPEAPAVVGQNFPPEIFLGPANVTGQVTAMFQDNTLVSDFLNESEVSILAYLTTSSDVASPAVSIMLPRIKFGAADVNLQGTAQQALTLPFQALLNSDASTGIPASTIQVVDTEAA